MVAYYVKRNNIKYKLNGLLLGSCVGAGFAVFETAGYAFQTFLRSGDLTYMMHILFLRGVLAIGCHVVWAAISGFGLIVAKGDQPLQTNHFFSAKFLKFFILVAALHAIWDWSIPFITTQMQIYLKMCGTDPDRPWHSAGIAERRPAAGIRNRSKGAGRGTGGRQQTVKRTEGNCTARRVKRV